MLEQIEYLPIACARRGWRMCRRRKRKKTIEIEEKQWIKLLKLNIGSLKGSELLGGFSIWDEGLSLQSV